MVVLPSILAANWSNVAKEIALCKNIGITHLHFDVMDGIFVPALTFGPKFVKDIRPLTTQFIDAHLMVKNPSNYIEAMAEAGADMFTFHIEEEKYSFRIISAIRSAGMKAGVALNPQTPVSSIGSIADLVDLVLIMSVDPGFGGQKYIPQVREKILALDKMKKERKLQFNVSVDGGINESNIAELYQSGANYFVMGTAFFSQENKKEYLKTLHDIVQHPET